MKYLLWFLPFLLLTACKESAEKQVQDDMHVTGDPVIDGLSIRIQEDPQNAQLYYERAKRYYEQDAYDQVLLDMQRAILIDSLKPAYFHLVADTQLDYYKSRDALFTMFQAAHRFPESIPTLLKLSEMQLILKQNEQSISTINNDILRQDPQNAEAYFMLGMNFRAMGDIPRALNSFQTAVEFDSGLTDAWIILAEMYTEKGSPEALKYYDNAVLSAPKNISALHSKAFYLQNHGDVTKAIAIYDQIHLMDKNYEEAYLNAGILYMEMDSLNLAYEQFNILAEIKPTDYRPYYYRGLVQELRGKRSAAISDLENSLNLFPDNEKAQQALKQLMDKEQ